MDRHLALPADLSGFDGERRVTPLNNSHVLFPADLIEYHNWQAGGGYGDPCEREPERVLLDVRDGAVSVEEAERVYGIVIRGGVVDAQATERSRQRIRDGRLREARPAGELDLEWIDPAMAPDATADPAASFSDVVTFDFGSDEARCGGCARGLGSAHGDFRRGCVVEEQDVSASGPSRGQDYGNGRIRLLLFYCPGCGRQLDCEVTARGGARPGFVLSN
jgi:N-methylhydantoinase B